MLLLLLLPWRGNPLHALPRFAFDETEAYTHKKLMLFRFFSYCFFIVIQFLSAQIVHYAFDTLPSAVKIFVHLNFNNCNCSGSYKLTVKLFVHISLMKNYKSERERGRAREWEKNHLAFVTHTPRGTRRGIIILRAFSARPTDSNLEASAITTTTRTPIQLQ